MNDRPNVAVLVPAAGRGLRMGGEPKQFRDLGGAPILQQTLSIFQAHPDVDAIIVAAPSNEVVNLRGRLRHAGISKLMDVVAGGASRQDSVGAALGALPSSVDIVLVHDAVRPFVPADRISAIVQEVRKYGAAALAISLSDTLRKGSDGAFGATVPRSGLYRMQTPQGFRRDWFEDAHKKAQQEAYQETDDVALVQRLGHPVRIVPGASTNIKITTPDDWQLAQALWASSRTAIS